MEQPGVDFFVGLETQMWEALVRGDGAADRELLSQDFLGVYPTGFADRDQHVDALADGPTMSAYTLSDARLTRICEDTVLLSYRADCTSAGRESTQTMFISSVWARRDGRWLNTSARTRRWGSEQPPRGQPGSSRSLWR